MVGGLLLAMLIGCSSDEESFIDAAISEPLPGTGRLIDRVRLRVERLDDPITERTFARIPVRVGETIQPLTFRIAPERATRASRSTDSRRTASSTTRSW